MTGTLIHDIPEAVESAGAGGGSSAPICSPSFRMAWAWGWPSPDTFDCDPIGNFVRRWMRDKPTTIDIFARNRRWATYTNDLNPETKAEYHMDAADFCAMLEQKKVSADLVIFDPPYSPTQMKACYDSIGISHSDGGSNAKLYARVRRAFEPLVRPGGVVLTFGWNTHGMMTCRGYEREELLVVCHGQAHNDTLCLAERKVQGGLFDTANPEVRDPAT